MVELTHPPSPQRRFGLPPNGSAQRNLRSVEPGCVGGLSIRSGKSPSLDQT